MHCTATSTNGGGGTPFNAATLNSRTPGETLTSTMPETDVN